MSKVNYLTDIESYQYTSGKKTFIYFIVSTPNPKKDYLSRLKIGFSKFPLKRLAQLQTGNPIKLHLWYSFPVSQKEGSFLEQQLHKKFRHSRRNGEWFYIHPCIRKFIKTHKKLFTGEKLESIEEKNKVDEIDSVLASQKVRLRKKKKSY